MIFTDREKTIYSAPNGSKFDPVAVHHLLIQTTSGNLDALLNLWWGEESEAKDKAGAAIQLAKAARLAFGFKPFDQPDGVLDAVVLETLYDFLEWLEKKE